MKLTLSEAERLLSLEIIWHTDHPDKELSKDHQEGFIKGLRQAQYLLKTAEAHLDPTRLIREFEKCEHGYVLNLCPTCFPEKTRAAK